jgi:hypothetical protein
MDEQEINREGLIAELKFRIAKLKDEIGYGEKGESKCSTESKDGSQKESSGSTSMKKIREQVLRSGLEQ